MSSYVTEYGSCARSSRVRTAASPLRSLTRVRALGNPGPGATPAPTGVVVSPKCDHVAVLFGRAFELSDANGAGVVRGTALPYGALTLYEDGLGMSGELFGWTPGVPIVSSSQGPSSENEVLWALLADDQLLASVTLKAAGATPLQVDGPGGAPIETWDRFGASVHVSAERFDPANRGRTALVWEEAFDTRGVGAIAPDRRIALALHDRRFVVLDGMKAQSPDKKHGARVVETRLSFEPYELSVVDDGYAVVGVAGVAAEAPPFDGFAAVRARRARRIDLGFDVPPRWRSVVAQLDAAGRETGKAELPFEVLQPPVDGGGGRVFFFGTGVAALDHGKLLYASPSLVPMTATAFADGSLAVAVGPELRILNRDGAVQATLRTANGEPITTPPAIASDGAVWVATQEALYVAR